MFVTWLLTRTWTKKGDSGHDPLSLPSDDDNIGFGQDQEMDMIMMDLEVLFHIFLLSIIVVV